jgi:hypothetical protein
MTNDRNAREDTKQTDVRFSYPQVTPEHALIG